GKAMPLREHREKQIHDPDACAGIEACETCQEYEGHVQGIAAALNLAPWQRNPIDAFDTPAPPWFDETEAKDWDRARASHLELAAAAGIPPAASIPTWDLSKPHV